MTNNPSDATVSEDDVIEIINLVTDLDAANALDMAIPEVTKRIEAIMSSALEQPDGYVDAYYEITSLLGIGAQPLPPKQVHENLVMPSLRRLVAQATWRDDNHRGEVIHAWQAGALAVHEEWTKADEEDRVYLTRDENPDFTEAAHDYAANLLTLEQPLTEQSALEALDALVKFGWVGLDSLRHALRASLAIKASKALATSPTPEIDKSKGEENA